MLNFENVKKFHQPFTHYILEDVFDSKFSKKLKSALENEKYEEQNSDLFTFLQCDIEKSQDKTIKEFREYLHSEFIAKISELLNIKLNRIDISAFKYRETHHLLPHDDRLAGRRIAYIFHFSTLSEQEGGAFGLFETKGFTPNYISKRIYPQENTLVLMPVTRKTFHEVEEVIIGERLTVAGWLHDK